MKIKKNSLALKKIDSAGKIIYRSGQWIILVLCFLIFIYLTFQSLLYTTSIYNAPDDPSTVIMMHDNFYINDINYISAQYGLKEWSDPKYWYMYKYAMCPQAIPEFAFNLANIIKSVITDMNPICNTQFYIYYIDSVDN